MNIARALKRFFTIYSVSLTSLTLLTISILVAISPYLQKQTDTVCGCAEFFTLTSSPAGWILMGSLLILTMLGMVMSWRILHMVIVTRRFRQTISEYTIHTTYYRGITIYTIQHNEPLAVCIGYLNPVVFISQTFIEQLSGFELFAVIQHEVAHAKRHDPLQRLLLHALPLPIPYWKSRVKQYVSAQEILADDAVMDSASIRSAFVKLAEHIQTQQPSIAGTWFSTSQARVNHWLGGQTLLPTFRFGFIGFILFAVVLVASYRAFAAEPSTQAFGQCLAVQTMCESVMSYVVQ